MPPSSHWAKEHERHVEQVSVPPAAGVGSPEPRIWKPAQRNCGALDLQTREHDHNQRPCQAPQLGSVSLHNIICN